MEQVTCNSCVYYRQHYTFDQRKIFRVYCGHCTYPSVKTKRPDSKICANYTQKKPDENTFVSKEYLSKMLLEYVLKLELLPTIYAAGDNTEKEILSQTTEICSIP